jgi:hypothetical protein
MVDVSMNLMPPRIIGKKTCLWVKSPSRLLKDHGLKKRPNTWKKEESKEIKEFMKVGKGMSNVIDIMAIAHNNELIFR